MTKRLKTCFKCHLPKDRSEFSKDSSQRDGLRYLCRECVSKYNKTVGEDGLTKQQRENARNPKQVRARQLKYKYGIAPEDFERMLNEQGRACAICRDIDKRWCVDHCHATGKVRAVLCNGCNVAIGNLKDSASLAAAVAEYLIKHGGSSAIVFLPSSGRSWWAAMFATLSRWFGR